MKRVKIWQILLEIMELKDSLNLSMVLILSNLCDIPNQEFLEIYM